MDRCLGLSKFVGRYFNTGKYVDVLRAAGIGEDHRCATLLRSLGTRGWVVGYTFAPIDGIHGWLDPAETRALRDELELLDLPRYPATVAALAELQDEPPGYSYEELSLSFVRTIAELATRSDDGILWGNDLWSVSDGPTIY